MATVVDITTFTAPTTVDGSVGGFWTGDLIGSGSDGVGEASGFEVKSSASPDPTALAAAIPQDAIITAVEMRVTASGSAGEPQPQPVFVQTDVVDRAYVPILTNELAAWGPLLGIGDAQFDGTLFSLALTRDDLELATVGWRLIIGQDSVDTEAISASVTGFTLRVTFDDAPVSPTPEVLPTGIDAGQFEFLDEDPPPSIFPGAGGSFAGGAQSAAEAIRRSPAITISEQLNVPPSCSITAHEITPEVGSTALVDVGTGVEFEGIVQTVVQRYEEQLDQLVYDLQLSDFVWLLNRRRPFGCFENVPADQVVLSIMGSFTEGFTTTAVQAGLANVTVNFDGTLLFSEALQAIAKEINAKWYLESKDLHFFTEEVVALPDDLTLDNDFLNRDLPISLVTDLSQIRTRQYGKGRGGTLVETIQPGDTTIQVAALDDFEPSGQVIVGCQVLSYGGKQTQVDTPAREAGPGAVTVGPLFDGPDIQAGPIVATPIYKVSFIKNGVETDLGTPKTGILSAIGQGRGSRAGPAEGAGPGEFPTAAGQVLYQPVIETTAGLHWITGASFNSAGPIGLTSGHVVVEYNWAPTDPADPRVTGIGIYRTKRSGGSQSFYSLVSGLTVPTAGALVFDDKVSDESLGSRAPEFFRTGFQDFARSRRVGVQMELTNIPLGAVGDGVTARKIYRSVKGGPFILITTLNDNETTTFIDTRATGEPFDGILDTGDEHPGSLASVTTFYLINIPSSGTGSITATALEGSDVNLWVQVDDLAAQTTLAGLEGGDGIHEGPIFVDTELDLAAMTATCTALLLKYSSSTKTLNFSSRDPKLQVGLVIHANLPAIATDTEGIFDPDIFDRGLFEDTMFDPGENDTLLLFDEDIFDTDPPDVGFLFDIVSDKGIFGDFLIQRITKTQIHEGREGLVDLAPLLTVTASSSLFTLEDLLQRVLLRN